MDFYFDICSNMGVLKMLEGILINVFFFIKKSFLICLFNYLMLYFNLYRYLNKNKFFFLKNMVENFGNI